MEGVWCYYLIEKQIYRNKFNCNKMTNEIYFSPAYRIARSMYIAVGGDPDKTFDSVEDIYADVNAIFEEKSSRVNITALNVNITESGSYNFDDEAVTGYRPVNVEVNIPQKVNFDRLNYRSTELADIQADIDATPILPGEPPAYWDSTDWFMNNTEMVYAPWMDVQFTDVWDMFSGCAKLQFVPKYDTSQCTAFARMFYNCKSLNEIPDFDFSKATTLFNTFNGCTSLKRLPLMDCGNVTTAKGMVTGCISLTDVGGFKDLGKKSNLNIQSCYFGNCSLLTRDSAMNILNNLWDRNSSGYSIIDVVFPPELINVLTEEDITVGVSKGWNVLI